MSVNPASLLELEHVSRRFDGRAVLRDISLSIPPGRITCLLGESGCGKSTLLRIISGVDRPDPGGRIRVGGTEVTGPGVFVEPEDRKIGFMFQDYALFPHLSVAQRIGIGHLLDRYPHSLSGGEQQRVALARALAPEPAVLLMDEPFSNLDQGLRERVRRETVDILRRIGTTAIIVTHDPQEALAVGDLIVLMRAGRIEQSGTPFEIYDRPRSAYAAEFMGPCNRLTGLWSHGRIETPIGTFPADLDLPDGSLALACIRPQALSIGPDGQGISARVVDKTFTGESEQIGIMVHPLAQPLRMHSHVRIPMAIGEKVSLQLNGAQIHVFPEEPNEKRPPES